MSVPENHAIETPTPDLGNRLVLEVLNRAHESLATPLQETRETMGAVDSLARTVDGIRPTDEPLRPGEGPVPGVPVADEISPFTHVHNCFVRCVQTQDRIEVAGRRIMVSYQPFQAALKGKLAQGFQNAYIRVGEPAKVGTVEKVSVDDQSLDTDRGQSIEKPQQVFMPRVHRAQMQV